MRRLRRRYQPLLVNYAVALRAVRERPCTSELKTRLAVGDFRDGDAGRKRKGVAPPKNNSTLNLLCQAIRVSNDHM
jgi:hypothetical protein